MNQIIQNLKSIRLRNQYLKIWRMRSGLGLFGLLFLRDLRLIFLGDPRLLLPNRLIGLLGLHWRRRRSNLDGRSFRFDGG